MAKNARHSGKGRPPSERPNSPRHDLSPEIPDLPEEARDADRDREADEALPPGPLPTKDGGFSILGQRRLGYLVSGAMVLGSLLLLLVRGLNWGIDFRGGSVFEVRFSDRTRATAEAVRQVLAAPEMVALLGETRVQEKGATDGSEPGSQDLLIFAGYDEAPGATDPGPELMRRLDALGGASLRSSQQVGPTIGKAMQRDAWTSIGLACLGMLVYMALRFEFAWGVASVLALVHDCLAILGVFALFRLEVTSDFLAAMLTIVGYSLNDSIIIMDRVRENLGQHRLVKALGREGVFDHSIRQSLSRTLNTSLTTLVPVVTLLVLGSPSLRPFALALLVGIVVGTYSSIFIVSALLVDFPRASGVRRTAT